MASADPAHVVICPSCGARCAVSALMTGRRGRCGACGTAFTVPAPTNSTSVESVPSKDNVKPASKEPQHIGVECRVCGTRMYGRLEHVGKKMKCPDCGALTVVPPPPKLKPKKMPAALEGEQYELWDADTQPLPSDLRGAQPKYIAVECRKCASLMYATEAEVGQQIVCPDCGTKHIVPPPRKPVVKPSVLASDAQTPKLDPAAAPGERPQVVPSSHRTLGEDEREAEYLRALEKSNRTGRPMELDRRGRPVLPRFPLLSGILPFPFYSGCPQRWFALTLGLLIWMGIMWDGVPAWATWNGDTMGAMRAMAGLAETMLGAVGAIIWLAAASSVFIAIATQSAVGHNRIREWPPMNFISSMSEMLPVSVAIVFTAAPGGMLGKLVAQEPWQLAALSGGSLLLGFPIAFLSQLASTSTWDVIELRVLVAAFRCPFSMILFYIESACLAAVCVSAAIAAAQVHTMLPLAFAPLYIACLFIYARLLGRLGWRLSEVMPADEVADDDERMPGPKNTPPLK